MIKCPSCKNVFSELDEPCKKCDGGCFEWKNRKTHGITYSPPPIEIEWKKSPCHRCNGNGKEQSAKNRGNRQRGGSNERKAVEVFTKWWLKADGSGYSFKRTPQSGGSQMAAEFDQAGDICTNAPDFPYAVECKRDKGWSLEQLVNPTGTRMGEFMDQALGDCPRHRISMLWLMHPGPSQPTFVMLQAPVDDAAAQIFLIHPHLTQPGTFTGARLVNGILIRYIVMSLKHFLAFSPDTQRTVYHNFCVSRGIV